MSYIINIRTTFTGSVEGLTKDSQDLILHSWEPNSFLQLSLLLSKMDEISYQSAVKMDTVIVL